MVEGLRGLGFTGFRVWPRVSSNTDTRKLGFMGTLNEAWGVELRGP